MAVFAVFKENVSLKYKSTLFSKATAVLLITTIVQIVIPLLISYRTGEFWVKTSTYQEQPNVRFKHEYILLLETDEVLRSVICGTGIHNDDMRNHCLLKHVEKDYNHDGRPDALMIDIIAPLHAGESIRSITVAFLMDLRLDNLCVLRTDSLVVGYYSSGLPGAKLDIVADVRLDQAKPLTYHCIDAIKKSLHLDGETEFQEILSSHSMCNVSLQLGNERVFWTTGHTDDQPFMVSLKLNIPEATVLYKPGVLQLLKWAWIQYFSVFIVISYLCYLVKKFIYSNNLVWTHKDKALKVF